MKRMKCGKINARNIFGKDIDDGIPWAQTLEWIRDIFNFLPNPDYYYLLVGDETFPLELWETKENNINSIATLVWGHKE